MLISLTSKRLFYRLTKLRVFALAFLLGVSVYWVWESQIRPHSAPTAFTVRFAPELPEREITTQEINLGEIIQNRNLAEYDQISVSNCAHMSDGEYRKCEKSLEKGRRFILNHWKKKKRAHIIYDWSGIDASAEIHIFIEPDGNGKWHIISRWEGDRRTFFYEDVPKIYEHQAVRVKSKKMTKNTYPFHAGEYYLIFIDENGQEKDSL